MCYSNTVNYTLNHKNKSSHWEDMCYYFHSNKFLDEWRAKKTHRFILKVESEPSRESTVSQRLADGLFWIQPVNILKFCNHPKLSSSVWKKTQSRHLSNHIAIPWQSPTSVNRAGDFAWYKCKNLVSSVRERGLFGLHMRCTKSLWAPDILVNKKKPLTSDQMVMSDVCSAVRCKLSIDQEVCLMWTEKMLDTIHLSQSCFGYLPFRVCF